LVVSSLQKHKKEKEKQKKKTHGKMNTQFNANVYCFTEEDFKDLLNNFEGKVVGEDGMKMADVMKHFFGDFVPDKENLVQPEHVELAPPPKKGKSKKESNVNAKGQPKPKKAKSSFLCYLDTIRTEVKEANPGKKIGELSKIHSQMWKGLSDEDKKPFIDKAEEDKKRYTTELEAWKDDANP